MPDFASPSQCFTLPSPCPTILLRGFAITVLPFLCCACPLKTELCHCVDTRCDSVAVIRVSVAKQDDSAPCRCIALLADPQQIATQQIRRDSTLCPCDSSLFRCISMLLISEPSHRRATRATPWLRLSLPCRCPSPRVPAVPIRRLTMIRYSVAWIFHAMPLLLGSLPSLMTRRVSPIRTAPCPNFSSNPDRAVCHSRTIPRPHPCPHRPNTQQ